MMTSSETLRGAAVAWQVHPSAAEGSSSFTNSITKVFWRGGAAGGSGADETSDADGSKDVWCPLAGAGDNEHWCSLTVEPEAGFDVLVVAEEATAVELYRVKLENPLSWKLHAATFGILYVPHVAIGSLGFHFEDAGDAQRFTARITAAVEAGVARGQLHRLPIISHGCSHGTGSTAPFPSATAPVLAPAVVESPSIGFTPIIPVSAAAPSVPGRAKPPPLLSTTMHEAHSPPELPKRGQHGRLAFQAAVNATTAAIAMASPVTPSTDPVAVMYKEMRQVTPRTGASTAALASWQVLPASWHNGKRLFGPLYEGPYTWVEECGNVPAVLVLLAAQLLNAGGLQAEGLFRIAPNKADCTAHRDALERGEVPHCSSPHIPAALIKIWFRELVPNVLDSLPEALISKCVTAVPGSSVIPDMIASLPDTQRALFKWLCRLLCMPWITTRDTKMNKRSLAVVIAPNIYTVKSENPMVEISRLQLITQFVEAVLDWQLQHSALLEALASETGFVREA